MIDTAVSFLGPDLESLTDDLQNLGKRHKTYGVQPQQLNVMGNATIFALEELCPTFSRAEREAWQIVMHFFAVEMSKGMVTEE
jgi:hemoglobin-like flavoprotein